MRRLIAFILLLCCCAGLLMGAHGAVTQMENDVTFTEQVVYGDVSALAGRSVGCTITCGSHMTWNSEYFFGDPGSYHTEFVFTQAARQQESFRQTNYFSVGLSGGYGYSGGTITPSADGYGKLVQAVADRTPAGEELEMELNMSDYVDYYVPDYYLSYESLAYTCDEWMSTMDYDYGTSYPAFCKAFRFPVQPEDTVCITVSKDYNGNIIYVDFQPENTADLEFVAAMNDAGCYILPMFRSREDGTPLEAEYPDGYGIYYIPWKQTGDRVTYQSTTFAKSVVTPDYASAENLYPLDNDTVVYAMEVNQDATKAWLLTREAGFYVVTVLDLQGKTCLNRLELFPAEAGGDNPYWILRDGLMLVYTDTQAALLDTRDSAAVIFRADIDPYPKCYQKLYFFSDFQGILEWNGQDLILVDSLQGYSNGAFWAMVLNEQGVRFLGEYECSLFDGNNPSYYSYITIEEGPLVLS